MTAEDLEVLAAKLLSFLLLVRALWLREIQVLLDRRGLLGQMLELLSNFWLKCEK